MKKRILSALLCATMIFSISGCGGKKNSDTEASSSETKRSGQYDINPEKLVSKLADYDNIEVTVGTEYEETDENISKYLTSLVQNYGGNPYKEITDRDTIEAGDYVNLDYTGYKDGEAFDGGSATDQLIDVSGNCAVGSDTGFIDGFTDDLVGAKKGDTVKSDMKFPDTYSNTDLAGQEVTFEFKINAIYDSTPMTYDDLDDSKVEELFGSSLSIKTVDDLKDTVKTQLDQKLYSAKVEAVKDYMVDNSEVEVPEDYLEARLNEYQTSFESDNCTDTQDLESYLSDNYNVSVDEARDTWKDSLITQIKVELIFRLIATKEKKEIDDDDFEKYIDYIMSASNSELTDETEVYKYFGAGSADEGETYLKNQYLVNKVIDELADSAKVNYSDDASEE